MLSETLAGAVRPLQITELIRILLEARVSEVLIVSGLVFLGVAIIGDISGWIDPGKNGRIVGGVIGSVLVITGLWMHGAPVAGAGDGAGPSTTSPTATSTATSASTRTLDAGSVNYPSGFDESGYTDRDAALEGHLRLLKGHSFTSTTRFDTDDGSTGMIRIRADPGTGRVYKMLRRDGSIQAEFFFESGVAETRTPGDEGFNGDVTSYDRAIIFDGQFEDILRATLSDPRVTRDRGTALITYGVTGEGTEGNLTINDDGLFLRYSVRSETERGTFAVRYRVTDFGNTTVEEPDWAGGGG